MGKSLDDVAQELTEVIDKATEPSEMSAAEAIEVLEEIVGNLSSRIACLEAEVEELG